MNISIKNVEIQAGKKTLNLSVDEAKELQSALNNAFPVNQYPYYPYYPYSPITWSSSNILEDPIVTTTDWNQPSTCDTVKLKAV